MESTRDFGCWKGFSKACQVCTTIVVGSVHATVDAACQKSFTQFSAISRGVISSTFFTLQCVAAVLRAVVHTLACKALGWA